MLLPSKIVTFFGWQVQHITDKLTSDFWIAENFLSNQVIGWADARMT